MYVCMYVFPGHAKSFGLFFFTYIRDRRWHKIAKQAQGIFCQVSFSKPHNVFAGGQGRKRSNPASPRRRNPSHHGDRRAAQHTQKNSSLRTCRVLLVRVCNSKKHREYVAGLQYTVRVGVELFARVWLNFARPKIHHRPAHIFLPTFCPRQGQRYNPSHTAAFR